MSRHLLTTYFTILYYSKVLYFTIVNCNALQDSYERAHALVWLTKLYFLCGVGIRQHTSAYVSIRQHASECSTSCVASLTKLEALRSCVALEALLRALPSPQISSCCVSWACIGYKT